MKTMSKYLLVAGAIVLFASCQKEQIKPTSSINSEINQTESLQSTFVYSFEETIQPNEVKDVVTNPFRSEMLLLLKNTGSSDLTFSMSSQSSSEITLAPAEEQVVTLEEVGFTGIETKLTGRNIENLPGKVSGTVLENPYEMVGKMHNELLDEVFTSSDHSFEAVHAKTSGF